MKQDKADSPDTDKKTARQTKESRINRNQADKKRMGRNSSLKKCSFFLFSTEIQVLFSVNNHGRNKGLTAKLLPEARFCAVFSVFQGIFHCTFIFAFKPLTVPSEIL